jgi:hypothetical protein
MTICPAMTVCPAMMTSIGQRDGRTVSNAG